jgi:hypothetical protein
MEKNKMENNQPVENKKHNMRRRGGFVGGAILVVIGLMSLINNIVPLDLGMWFLVGLGIIFMTAAFVTRKQGFLIPGGILSGIGVGILVMEKSGIQFSEPGKGGAFLLCFAAGWFLITLLSLAFPAEEGTGRLMWWPLIPGVIMAGVGGLLFAGDFGLTILKWMGQGWPVVLIALGLYLIFRRKELEEKDNE